MAAALENADSLLGSYGFPTRLLGAAIFSVHLQMDGGQETDCDTVVALRERISHSVWLLSGNT